MNKYLFANSQDKLPVSNTLKSLIKKCCDEVLLDRGFNYRCEIAITFTDNEQIRQINRENRNIDSATDVLSFPQIEFDSDYRPVDIDMLPNKTVVLGDIVISLEKAQEQAENYGHSFTREVCFLCVHSMLHLLGYDHIENEQPMFALQDKILNKLEIKR